MAERTLAVVWPGHPDVLVEVHVSANGWVGGMTNADGYIAFPRMDAGLGDSDVRITAPGYRQYVTHITWHHLPKDAALPQPLNQQVVVGVDLPEPVSEVPQLQVNGRDFVDAQGARHVLSGCDVFTAYRLWLDGNIAQLEALVRESHELDFTVWRVFMMGAISQNTVMELRPQVESNYYDQIRPFVNWLNARGIIPLLTVFVDAQVVMPDSGARRDHWMRVNGAVAGASVLVSGGNEWPKNGFDPNELPHPGGGAIWSRGSNLSDQVTPANGATASEFHQRRDFPKTFLDSVASAVEMQDVQGYGMIWMDEPLGAAESERPGSRSAQPGVFYKLARVYATYWALAIFHSDAGQRGQLLGPVQKECARAWQRGMLL